MRIRFILLLLVGMTVAALAYLAFPNQDTTGPISSQDSDEASAQLIPGSQDGGAPPSEPILGPDGEEIAFQAHRASFAWARVSKGFYINVRGEVRRFNSFDAADHARYPLALPPNPRHADLLKSFGAHPELVAVLPAAELAAAEALAQEARNAPLVCGQAAMDAGGIEYEAWVMGGDGVYSAIRLGGEGDVSCRSLSPAGARVKRWLQRVTGMSDRGLQLPARACKARPCSRGEDCFSVTYCDSVPNCSWCDGSTVCVEGPDGKKHCSLGDHFCNDRTCRCFGQAICPGGEMDCREAAGGALTCARPWAP